MTRPFKRLGRRSTDDDERLTRLYMDTRKDLLAFLLRRCATAEDAADCLAETYRVAWEKRERIPSGHDGRPWLFGVARNAAREARRGGERRAATSHALAAAAESFYTVATPEDNALDTALSELSELDREIVMMLSTDGLPSREVASILGLSPNAVRIRAHRARTKLRTLMSQGDAEEVAEPPDRLRVAANDGP